MIRPATPAAIQAGRLRLDAESEEWACGAARARCSPSVAGGSGEAGRCARSVRVHPSGVRSKAHAQRRAIGKPEAITNKKAFIVQEGASKVGSTIAATCTRSHAVTQYAAATLNTLRRRSSEMN